MHLKKFVSHYPPWLFEPYFVLKTSKEKKFPRHVPRQFKSVFLPLPGVLLVRWTNLGNHHGPAWPLHQGSASCILHSWEQSHICYPILDTRISVLLLFVCNAQGTPPWILKQGGLESSEQIPVSLNGKTKRIICYRLFLVKQKNIFH